MTYNSRLFNAPKLRRVVEVTDDLAEECGLIADALADYENASELPQDEQAEAREEARNEAWNHLGELLSHMEALRQMRDELGAMNTAESL